MTYKSDATERIMDFYEAGGAEVDRDAGMVKMPDTAHRRFEVTIGARISGFASDWDGCLLVDLILDNGETVSLDPMRVRLAGKDGAE